MYSVVTEIKDDDWDQFVVGQRLPDLVQSASWAHMKAPTYRPVRVGLTDTEGRLCAGMQILVRDISKIGAIGYAPGADLGPSHLTGRLLQAVTDELDRQRVQLTVLQSNSQDNAATDSALAGAGFGPGHINVAPSATIEIDLHKGRDELLAAMSGKRRANIRRAERLGVEVRRAGIEDLELFHRLHVGTATHQQFEPMTLEYLERQWHELHPRGQLAIFFTEIDGQALSANMVTTFADRVTAKLVGRDTSVENWATYRASDYVHWGAILWGMENGYRWYDFGGMNREIAESILSHGGRPASLENRPEDFKYRFGGQVRLCGMPYQRLRSSILRPIYQAIAPKLPVGRMVDRLRTA